MEYEIWLHRLQKDAEMRKEGHPLWPVMHLLHGSNSGSKRPKKDDVSKDAMDSIRAAVPKNLQSLIDRGFLQRPDRLPALATSSADESRERKVFGRAHVQSV